MCVLPKLPWLLGPIVSSPILHVISGSPVQSWHSAHLYLCWREFHLFLARISYDWSVLCQCWSLKPMLLLKGRCSREAQSHNVAIALPGIPVPRSSRPKAGTCLWPQEPPGVGARAPWWTFPRVVYPMTRISKRVLLGTWYEWGWSGNSFHFHLRFSLFTGTKHSFGSPGMN